VREDGQVLGLLGARQLDTTFGLVDLLALPPTPEAAGAATA
jgi:hypothetical protein